MNVIAHYDKLIDDDNDSFRDPEPLREYMDLWDGRAFIDAMSLSNEDIVLEIGVGTGRIAAKVAPFCAGVYGIDISPKTIERAKVNLKAWKNIELICADFSSFNFNRTFDVIYSSLTLIHFEDKESFFRKVSDLLVTKGRFVLSIDKNQSNSIDYGTHHLTVYPDDPERTRSFLCFAGLTVKKWFETEFAHIFVCTKEGGDVCEQD